MPIAMVISGKPASIAYAGAAGSGVITATNTYSFAGAAIGTAATGRLVVVAVSYASAAAATCTLTIGGNTATEIAGCARRTASGGSTEIQVRLYALTVDTGATAAIALTTSTNFTICNIALWAAYDVISTTEVATSNSWGNGVTSLTLNINNSPGGVVCSYGVMPNAVAWTGLTEDFDAIVGGTFWQSGASGAFTSGNAPLAVSVNTSPGTGAIGCAVSFR